MDSAPPTLSEQIKDSLNKSIIEIPARETEYRVRLPNGKTYIGSHSSYLLILEGDRCLIYGSQQEIETLSQECDPNLLADGTIKTFVCEEKKVVEVKTQRGMRTFTHSAMMTCPVTCLEEYNTAPFIYPYYPGMIIGLGIARGNDATENPSMRTRVAYRYMGGAMIFASAILKAWEARVHETILTGLGGIKGKTTMEYEVYNHCENDIRLESYDIYQIESSSLKETYDNYTRIYEEQFKERNWYASNRGAVVVQEIIREHVAGYLLPRLFYDLADDRLKTYFSEKWGLRKGFFEPLTYGVDMPTRFYLKIAGVNPAEMNIPDDVLEKFTRGLDKRIEKDISLAIRRKKRTESDSEESIEQTIDSFIKSITTRFRDGESRPSSTKLLRDQWKEMHLNALSKMVRDFQKKHPGIHFHIDHIIPLVALPQQVASDIMSLAWHPCNLQIIHEEKNMSKSSTLKGKKITKTNKTTDDENLALKELSSLYDIHTNPRGSAKVTYSE